MDKPLVVLDGGCTEKASTYDRIRISEDTEYGGQTQLEQETGKKRKTLHHTRWHYLAY